MATLEVPRSLVDLVAGGPLAHVVTINPDGSPQVSVVWIGFDGDTLVSGHLSRNVKVRNVERDPRVAITMEGPRTPGEFLAPYAAIHATAAVEPSDGTWDLLDRLAKVYIDPDATFPAPRSPGFVLRYTIDSIGGQGPWAGGD